MVILNVYCTVELLVHRASTRALVHRASTKMHVMCIMCHHIISIMSVYRLWMIASTTVYIILYRL